VEQDWARPESPWKTFAQQGKSLRRRLQYAVARRRLTAAARVVNVPAIAARCVALPKLSVIALAGGDRQGGLAGIDSLARQAFPVGDIQIVAPGGESPALLDGIGRALKAGGSSLVAVCDASAVWEEDATLWVALAFARQPNAKALFADHAENGVPVHKPDFSWAYLLARDFVAPVVVYDRLLLEAAVDALGRLDWQPASVEAATYAIALEAMHGLAEEEILHVRHPLWLKAAGGSIERSQAGLAEAAGVALRRRGIKARVTIRPDDPALQELSFERTSAPKVSIIIPTKNAADLVAKCIADLRASAAYDRYEIVVIDHESDEPRLREYLTSESAAGRLRVFPYRGPFNYAAMNNAAIRHTDGDLVLLLNNDVDGFSAGWLYQMVATMELDARIAAVGALLHYPDGAIQHAGVILTPKRPCIAAHAGLPRDALGYQGRIRSLQEFSAVTAAFMLMKRSAFEQVGGFDEVFPDDYNDIDLCLRLRQAGFQIVYNPQVQASHWESRSRRPKETAKDLYLARWCEYFPRDPFYSPHLSMKEFRPDDLSPLWRERKRIALQNSAESGI
jgi:GT2 family glycosyltransferase